MNAYLPLDWPVALFGLLAILVTVLFGYFVTKIRRASMARAVAWLAIVCGVGGMDWLTLGQPAGFRMLMIIGILLSTMKIIVAAEVQLSGKANLRYWQWLGFAGLWVGMRPALFAAMPRQSRTRVTDYLWRGIANLLLGFSLVIAARGAWLMTVDLDLMWRLLLTTILLLPGISLMLHFGIFNLLTAFWRWMGVECDSIFRAPLKSASLTEFWGKRWNLAFSEMTSLAVFRPLKDAFGQLPAMLVAFVFSGILHELAISVPVRAGFGWPTLYFLLHGLAMLAENRWRGLAQTLAAYPWLGRLWTLAWILIPLPILFHQPFLRGCVWPLVGIEWSQNTF